MADIHCARCGEPWDAYGLRNRTDFSELEAQRFVHGQGCPHCWADPRLIRTDQTNQFLDDLVDPGNFDTDPLDQPTVLRLRGGVL